MAVKLTSPWHEFAPGAVIDRGEATDAKLIALKLAVKIEKAAKQPKEKPHGSA